MNFKALALSPLIVGQALWVAARAARLPEASGDRSGEKGSGPLLRLLVVGDSSAAGVGVASQSEALDGRLASELAEKYRVQWNVVARSGGTVRSTTRMLEGLPKDAFDIAIVALGVNDTKNGVSLKTWKLGYGKLLDKITGKFGTKLVCVSGLPPIRQFPILPSPLNRVLGDRVELFDEHLRQIAQDRTYVIYLPLNFTLDTTKMASDGFHPGPEIYAEWASRAAKELNKAMA